MIDWREESQKDSILSASNHKIRVAQMMSISRLSRIKNFARRWTARARKSLESKKVEAIERESDLSRVAFQAKLMNKLKKSPLVPIKKHHKKDFKKWINLVLKLINVNVGIIYLKKKKNLN